LLYFSRNRLPRTAGYHDNGSSEMLGKHLPISFEVMLPSACRFILDGSLSYV
jgi:hypothetical protein